MTHPRRLVPWGLLLLLAGLLAGCGPGAGAGDRAGGDAKLLLDFSPNAAHVGIYVAEARGYDEAEDVNLEIQVPGPSSSGVKLLAANKVDYAILDLHDLAIARQEGQELTAVMAIVERPLAAVIAQPSVRTPKDLEGERVGVTGLPSDDAVLRTVLQGGGADPSKVRKTVIGFGSVSALLARRVAGATAFWDVEGLELQRRRPGTKIFRVERYGAPAYPELVLVARTSTVQDRPASVQAVVAALQRGYRSAINDPASAVEDELAATEGLRRDRLTEQLQAVSPLLQGSDGAVGTFDMALLREWATWEQRVGIVRREPEVALMFQPRFAREAAGRSALDDG